MSTHERSFIYICMTHDPLTIDGMAGALRLHVPALCWVPMWSTWPARGNPYWYLSEPITTEMIIKATGRMDLGKAAGPSGIIGWDIEACRVSWCSQCACPCWGHHLRGPLPYTAWYESYIVSLYKGKGDALNRVQGLSVDWASDAGVWACCEDLIRQS